VVDTPPPPCRKRLGGAVRELWQGSQGGKDCPAVPDTWQVLRCIGKTRGRRKGKPLADGRPPAVKKSCARVHTVQRGGVGTLLPFGFAFFS